MKKIQILLAGCALLLSGCAGVKSSFDCNATTSDTCMTMTKANQMARDKVTKQAGKQGAGGLPSLVNLPVTSAFAASSALIRSAATVQTVPARTAISSMPGTTRTMLAARTSVVTSSPSCQSIHCDNPGTVYPQRIPDRIATVWIAPWVDSDNTFHQPGRVSFVVSPAGWLLPSRIN